MSTVYFLLRNNAQLGPYTIDELLQQSLRDKDLVWAEGSSTVWSFPSELTELQPWFPPKMKKEDQPEGTAEEKLERRAEELRQKALSASLQSSWQTSAKEASYEPHGFILPEEAQIEFIDHRNDRKRAIPLSEMLAAAMVTVIVGASLYGGRVFLGMSNKQEMTAALPVRVVAVQENTAKAPLTMAEPIADTATMLAADSLAAVDSLAAPVIRQEPVQIRKDKKQPDSSVKEPIAASNEIKVPEVSRSEETAKAVVNPPDADSVKKQAPEVQPEEKKKSLGQVLKGLFKKKKKDRQPADSSQTKEAPAN
ncbi:MAG TPA: GYF domain-containing protein [Flavisolibacter sp.]|jgi:hypothetical protein|nr:GYF domain-containing protein [Flavisolibacter sp.]